MKVGEGGVKADCTAGGFIACRYVFSATPSNPMSKRAKMGMQSDPDESLSSANLPANDFPELHMYTASKHGVSATSCVPRNEFYE
jgi:hypothetical protein